MRTDPAQHLSTVRLGHISIGMDAIHDCLLDLLSLVLMQSNINPTLALSRSLVFCLTCSSACSELEIFEPNRRLPDYTWSQIITVLTTAEHLYETSLNKKTWPVTKPLAITSNLLPIDPIGPMAQRAGIGIRARSANIARALTTPMTAPPQASI